MSVLFLMSIFDCTRDWKCHLKTIVFAKGPFLSPCFCWDLRLSLREMYQKYTSGGTIAYGNSYLELFCHFKIFRLPAILHVAAEAVRAYSGKDPCYCYMIGRGPKSCLLGHVTWLLFCLYVKIFLPSIFNSVDIWNSISCIVLDIELTEKNKVKNWDFLLMVRYKDFHFVHQSFLNLMNRLHGTQVIYTELRGVVKSWIMRSSLLSFTTSR